MQYAVRRELNKTCLIRLLKSSLKYSTSDLMTSGVRTQLWNRMTSSSSFLCRGRSHTDVGQTRHLWYRGLIEGPNRNTYVITLKAQNIFQIVDCHILKIMGRGEEMTFGLLPRSFVLFCHLILDFQIILYLDIFTSYKTNVLAHTNLLAHFIKLNVGNRIQ